MRLAVILTITVALVAVIFILGNGTVSTNNQDTDAGTSTSTGTSTEPSIGPKEITIIMSDQNGSGQAGIARITEVEGRAKVILQLAGGPNNISQPAHIHDGTCQIMGAVKYPLTTARNGVSETILPVSFDDLIDKLPLAINIHKSLSETDVNMSCGDIRTNL